MDNHDELNRTLGMILGEVKGVNQRLDMVNGRLNKHDDKINSLESFKDQHVGKASIVGMASGAIFGVIGAWFSAKLGI